MKFKKEEVSAIRSHFMNRESWLRVRKKKREQYCPECKVRYSEMLSDKIGIMAIVGKVNQHMCNDCCTLYSKEYGIDDLYEKVTEEKKSKDNLINEIMSYPSSRYAEDRLRETKSIEELEEIKGKLQRKKEYDEYIEGICTDDWVLDEYLKEQYGVIMDTQYLKDVSQLEKFFDDYIYDDFECGQGYYTDSKKYIVLIDHKFYSVTLNAEIGSAKQDRGDRLYWVEGIESITYEEIPKPIEKKKKIYRYNFIVEILEEEKKDLDKAISKYKPMTVD